MIKADQTYKFCQIVRYNLVKPYVQDITNQIREG